MNKCLQIAVGIYYFLYLITLRQSAVNPMDGGAASFHVAKPRHLALRETPDLSIETLIHLVVGALALEIERYILVFEAIAEQAWNRHAAINKALHLLHHATCETLA